MKNDLYRKFCFINNNNNNKHDNVYGAVNHHGRAIARVHPVHLMNVEWRQAAADPRPSQTTSAVSPPVQAARNYTHHRHLLLLLSPKADTHFTDPQRVEG